MEHYYHYLEDLVTIIKSLYPHRETVNPYDKLITETSLENKELLERLIHSLTLLHQQYRVEDRWGRFCSTREDLSMSLLLVSRTLNHEHCERLLSRPDRWFYSVLLSEFEDQIFTRSAAQRVSGLSKTNTHWKLCELESKGLIAEKTGSRGQGYRYQLRR